MSASKSAALALAALFLAWFAPMLLSGEVIYPHDNGVEMGLERDEGERVPQGSLRSNRKFSDLSSAYVPEIAHHLRGDHAAWLSTWNPHVELGRPSMQISGLGPAFPITRVLMWCVHDEFALYTWLTVLTLALVAWFGFGFLRSLDLHPWACFAGASFLALGVFSIHYASVVMLLATFAWSLALLWGITAFVERRTFARGLAIAFATYMLFLSGYAQHIVWHAYWITGYAIARTWKREHAVAGRARVLVLLFLSALAGFVATAPVYADLALQAASSGRLETDHEFFLARLPRIASLRDLASYCAQATDAFWHGNPIEIEDLDAFSGLSFTPAFAGLFLIAWMDGLWRRSALWMAFAAVTFVMTIWPAAYLFGVDHLGLSLSRFVPLRAGVLPIGVAAAMSADHVLRGGLRRRALAAAIVLSPLALLVATNLGSRDSLAWGWVAASVAAFALTVAFVFSRKAVWIALIAIGTTCVHGRAMLLARPQSSIVRTSPLVESLGELTAGGYRYACVGAKEPRLLPPNQEARLGLASIHSYDPLSSERYQSWVLRVSESGARTFGRQFRRIASETRLASEDVAYAAVSTLVATQKLRTSSAKPISEHGAVRLYAPVEKPVRELQVEVYDASGEGVARLLGGPSAQRTLAMRRTVDRDDVVGFELTAAPSETLLFVSQQYHSQWRARSGDRELDTVEINGFYQGVRVPAGTRDVELRFEPFAVWSSVPQLAFVAAAMIAGAIALRARLNGARAASAGSSPAGPV